MKIIPKIKLEVLSPRVLQLLLGLTYASLICGVVFSYVDANVPISTNFSLIIRIDLICRGAGITKIFSCIRQNVSMGIHAYIPIEENLVCLVESTPLGRQDWS